MSFLLINTCGDEAVVALGSEVAGVEAEERMPGRTASEGLLGAVRRLLGRRRVGELAGVGVVVGPGSFTGVRVGLSAAKGLCLAADIGLIGMSRLRLLARQGEAAVLDAGRGEFFCLADGERLIREQDLPAGALITSETKVRERLGERVRLVDEPGGRGMLAAVLAAVAAGAWQSIDTLDASYLRRTDAEIAVDRSRP